MTKYRVQYTSVKPGGAREREDDLIYAGDRGIFSINDYLDNHDVWAADPIVVTEHTQSDGIGRIVPDSEWDICEN